MNELLIIVGPTAVGKTELSLTLAEEINAEIISADSMQVYRGMDIGTAKPSREERARVPHHLIDVADARDEFSVMDYLKLAEQTIADIKSRGKVPLVVGGTGLYVRALTNGIFEGPSADWDLRKEMEEKERNSPGLLYSMLDKVDPISAAKIQPADIRRIIRALEVYQKEGTPISRQHEEHKASATAKPVRIAGLKRDRTELYRRIEARVDAMMAAGFISEVRALRLGGCTRGMVSMHALGYKQLLAHLDGELTLDEAVGLIKRDSKRYAKRQFTWFNAEPRVNWVDLSGVAGNRNALEELKKALDIFRVLS